MISRKTHKKNGFGPGQMVYSRSSYKPEEIEWGQKFVYTVQKRNGKILVDVGKINESESAMLN